MKTPQDLDFTPETCQKIEIMLILNSRYRGIVVVEMLILLSRYRGIVAIQGNYPQKCCHSAMCSTALCTAVQKCLLWQNDRVNADSVLFGTGGFCRLGLRKQCDNEQVLCCYHQAKSKQNRQKQNRTGNNQTDKQTADGTPGQHQRVWQ